MRTLLHILCICLFTCSASAQITPADNDTIQANKFITYAEHTDSSNNVQYQVGRYRVGDKSDLDLPVYLRITGADFENYYDLHKKYDPDLFSFMELASTKFAVIKERHTFYLYDIRRQTLSQRLHPGFDQYEGEDGISGLVGAITLFDEDRFLLGSIHGFGIFCYDISDPANPSELMQYRMKKANEDALLHAFFYKTKGGSFDMLRAELDVSAESEISVFSKNLKPVRYMERNIALDLDSSKFTIPQPRLGSLVLPETYFKKISAIQKHTVTGETEEFCSRDQYVYENGVRYSFTDYGPCEQCGHSVAETFIPNFTVAQGFMFLLVLYGSLDLEEIVIEQFTGSEIRFLWRFSDIKILHQEGGVLIVEDTML